jgi:hypothetical protein
VLGGQVPCYSSVISYLVPPAVPVTSTAPESVPAIITGSSAVGGAAASTAAASTPTQIPTSAVVNIVFAVQYNVLPGESGESGLSTGTKAGIGVGAGVAGILIIALSLLLVWRTRMHKKDKKALAAIQTTGPDPTRQDQGEMSSKVPFVYSTRTELQSDVNPLGQTPGNLVSQEQRGYYPHEQQQMQMQQGVQNPGYSGPQQGQYMQQVPEELPFHHQSPPPGSEGYGYQTGYVALATPGDHFVSSTVPAQPHPQGYGYHTNHSTPSNTAPIFQQ